MDFSDFISNGLFGKTRSISNLLCEQWFIYRLGKHSGYFDYISIDTNERSELFKLHRNPSDTIEFGLNTKYSSIYNYRGNT